MRNIFREQPVAGESIMSIAEETFPYLDIFNTTTIYVNKKGMNPVFNILIKKVAACLSDIEMALVCNRVTQLQFSTNILKGMLLNLSMPAARRLASQMQELAKENKTPGVRNLLISIKKIIANSMQTQQSYKNW